MKLRTTALAAAAALALMACGKKEEAAAPTPAAAPASAPASVAAAPAAGPADKWINDEFQPSTLSKAEQATEMKWFIDAAAKLKAAGVNEISVVSEITISFFLLIEYFSRATRSIFAGIFFISESFSAEITLFSSSNFLTTAFKESTSLFTLTYLLLSYFSLKER